MRESILDGSLARTLKKQKVPWKSVVDGVLGEVSALASVVGVKVDSSKVSTDVVEADEALLKMALKQVVVNAILASVSGGKLVALQTAAMGQNIGLAALDSGSAVPRENLHGLYQMPYAGVKAADGTLCRADGTGLCLARGIVEAHSGTFLAESPPQGGLRVVMILAAPSRG
jgi:K+-sensing histidine kinase KdpD